MQTNPRPRARGSSSAPHQPTSRGLRYALLAASFVALPAPAAAQVFGPWVAGVVRYASPGGVGNGLSPATPTDLATAMAFARATLAGAAPVPVTINLLSGTYQLTATETMPARGLALEAHFIGNGRPILQRGNNAIFDVTSPGPAGLPNSEIRGLVLQLSLVGVRLRPWFSGGASATTAVVIRDCIIRENGTGIQESATDLFPTTHLIDRCEFTENGVGISIDQAPAGQTQGASSTVIRANKFVLNNTGISITGTQGAFDRRPRIISNHMRAQGAHIVAQDCSPVIVNNTLAFVNGTALFYNAVAPEILIGANNIFFNPGATDVVLGTGAVASFSFNSSTTMALGGVGNFVANPAFVATNDLHLTPTSPVIELGNNGFVLPPLLMNAGPLLLNLPADASIDMDGSPRLADRLAPGATVDIGADEVPRDRDTLLFDRRLAIDTTTSTNVDDLGNVVGSGAGASIDLEVRCQPGAMPLVTIMLSPTDTPNQNFVNTPLDPFGNWLLDMSGTGTSSTFVLASGFADLATGLFRFTFPVTVPAIAPDAARFHVQAMVSDLGTGFATGEFTNAQRFHVSQ